MKRCKWLFRVEFYCNWIDTKRFPTIVLAVAKELVPKFAITNANKSSYTPQEILKRYDLIDKPPVYDSETSAGERRQPQPESNVC